MSTRSLLASLTLLVVALASPACKKKQEEAVPSIKPATEAPAPAPTPMPQAERPAEPPQQPSAAVPPPAMVRFAEVTCVSSDKDRTVMSTTAPEGAVCSETAEGLLIAAGDSFHLVLKGTKPDLPARRKEIESNTGTSQRFKRFTTANADMLVWETDDGTGKLAYHFIGAKKIGDKDFVCQDDKDKTYTREQVDRMAQACLTMAKKAEAAQPKPAP